MTNPTHADFARAYRELAERKMNAIGLVCVDTAKIHQAANIIESQERELSGISGELERMTARAEQAEAGEKAVIAVMNGFCQFCEHYEKGENEEPCRSCESVTHDGRESKWTRRGLPQDGEGKK